ncbi:MAG: aminotransferase class I/II-fold pyridoxal phosphate-dependent enzyme, partial [Deltaproteobacteria bacterium]|nr:aminotransferase class I/II-fold pyridoxal phosphate-dependent enzyme [Deltaproteobacteria bacterium]
INGCSKAYAMTGWRIGYAAGEAEIITGMAKIMSQRTTNTCSISQIAAVTALNGDKIVINQMVEEYRKRRDYMVKGLNEIGISCEIPPATFYLFPDISFLLKKRYDGKQIRTAVKLCMLLLEKENIAIKLCMLLLEKENIAIVPGEPFGSNKNIRISFATSIENIKKGLKRIKRFLSKLS